MTTDQTATQPTPTDILARHLHDLRAAAEFGLDFEPYETLSDVGQQSWRKSAARIIAAMANPNGEPLPIPSGLDARLVVRFTVHCSHCGKPAPGFDFEGPCLWTAEDLPKLGNFHLNDCDWQTNDGLTDPEFEGRALVCPECWQFGWCETCDDRIHAWQMCGRTEADVIWHKTCGSPGSEPLSRDAYREVSQ